MSNLHTLEFAQQAVDLVKVDQPIGGGDLSLKICMVNNLRWFSALPDMTPMLPAVLIEPMGVLNPEPEDLNVTQYDITYLFRAWLLSEFGETADPLEDKLTKTKYLADVFLKSPSRFTSPAAGVQVLYNLLTQVEYSPEEEAAFLGQASNAWLVNVHFLVRVSTTRS